MSKRISKRVIAAMLMLCMILPISGCNSLFLKVATNIANTPEEQSKAYFAWPDEGERRIEIKNEYKSGGTNAFYIDEEKCLKEEIEEFHLIHVGSSHTVYYYTAATNPSYKKTKYTGYYCLAAYSFNNMTYKVLADGFYDKKNGNASFAFEKDPEYGYAFACLGDTFMDIAVYSFAAAKVSRTFTLSDDDKKAIRKKVGGNYVCTDLAYIDYGDYRIAAVFMFAGDSDDGEIPFAEYDIDFDTSEKDPVHDVDCINTGMIDSDSIVTSAAAYPSYGTVYTYNYKENEKKLKLFRDSPFADNKRYRGANISLNCKSDKKETLVSLSAKEYVDETGEILLYLFLLFDDRLLLYHITVAENDKHSYKYIDKFSLDKSDSYAMFDVTPSIVMVSPDKIFGCSLNRGFYVQSIGEEHTQIKAGSYYAAYTPDDTSYCVIGFDNKTHKRTTTNYVGDTVVSSSTEDVEYTMSDLPFAKIYKVTIPYHLQ